MGTGILTDTWLDTSNNPKIVKTCKESKLQRPGTFCLDGENEYLFLSFLQEILSSAKTPQIKYV